MSEQRLIDLSFKSNDIVIMISPPIVGNDSLYIEEWDYSSTDLT